MIPTYLPRSGQATQQSGQATQQWDGTGAPGDDDSVVDLFQGPGGVEAWAVAVPAKQNLAAHTRTTIRASAAAHPCPATPQTDQAITIGGAPAQLLSMQCPSGSGFLVELAGASHHHPASVPRSPGQYRGPVARISTSTDDMRAAGREPGDGRTTLTGGHHDRPDRLLRRPAQPRAGRRLRTCR